MFDIHIKPITFMKVLQYLVLCLGFLGYSQNKVAGIILDDLDHTPLEFVGIYNEQDHTMSNRDGRFLFLSTSNTITFYRPGYEKLITSFENVTETIYLSKTVLELNEVTVSNEKTIWQKVRDSLKNNYPLYPYQEKFLVRGVLRYNGEIIRIQDMQGKLQRKTLLYTDDIEPSSKDFIVELTNMRKVGLIRDENEVYFKFDSFESLFKKLIPLNATGDDFQLTEYQLIKDRKIKLNFQSLPSVKDENIYGHYIINTDNNAVEYFHIFIELANKEFLKSKNSRYRTVFMEREVTLTQNPKNRKYHIESAKFDAKVEQTDAENTYTSFYDVSFMLTTSENEGDFQIKKNVSTSKDLFKIKHPYNATYWNSQNQLLLTDEMVSFIKKTQDPNQEFRLSSNIID